jgi:hypothetical protein
MEALRIRAVMRIQLAAGLIQDFSKYKSCITLKPL